MGDAQKQVDWWVFKNDTHGVPYQHDGPHSTKEEAEHGLKSLQTMNKEDTFLIGKVEIVESEQKRKERLRIEAAYELYCVWCGIMGYPKFCIEDFKCTEHDLTAMLAIVDKTGYQVEGDKDGSVPVQANKLPENGGKPYEDQVQFEIDEDQPIYVVFGRADSEIKKKTEKAASLSMHSGDSEYQLISINIVE